MKVVTGRCHGRIPACIQVVTLRRRSRHFNTLPRGTPVPALIDKVTDIAKKLRKSAKNVNDPVLQELITDLSLSLADLRVSLAEQRQTTTDTTDTTDATETTTTRSTKLETGSTRASTLATSTTTTQLPDIGELRKFPD
jgi:hypothetical protein